MILRRRPLRSGNWDAGKNYAWACGVGDTSSYPKIATKLRVVVGSCSSRPPAQARLPDRYQCTWQSRAASITIQIVPRTHLSAVWTWWRVWRGQSVVGRRVEVGPSEHSQSLFCLLCVVYSVNHQWSDWRSFLCTLVPLMYIIIGIWGSFVLLTINRLFFCLWAGKVNHAPVVYVASSVVIPTCVCFFLSFFQRTTNNQFRVL